MTEEKNKILLFNPRSNEYKPRIPNSILQVAASVDGKYEYVFVDGNLENDPWTKIENYLLSDEFKFFASTVMPGPQLKQAIPFSKKIKKQFPETIIIWGGYFPSNQYKSVLNSGYIDFVINGPGDKAFPCLVDAIENKKDFYSINNLIFKVGSEIIMNKKDEIYEQDSLPDFPYKKLDSFYPLQKYLGKTYLGTKTIAYHSSFGCPFTCSFCAVVPIYNARWKGKSAENIYKDIKYLKENYGGNAIEFHDNNFFVSEKRVVEFSQLIQKENMVWWGEGRIDTINKYADNSLKAMRQAGCKMIFFGAETGNDALLKKMDKGGTQTGKQIREFAGRMKKLDIIPEYSFVLGTPADSADEVWKQINEDIEFIKKIKEINPDTEIIIYVYSPVPTEGSAMYNAVLKSGFRFPEKLEDWLDPHWENFDLRKNPLTPWLTSEMVDHIKNFETVINGYYPTVSDVKLKPYHKKTMKAISGFRYKSGFYKFPYEIKLLQKVWKYRQPETEGF
jgi:anaerobic magnesium-protoporphyrin IX monomethyl ester cyclase